MVEPTTYHLKSDQNKEINNFSNQYICNNDFIKTFVPREQDFLEAKKIGKISPHCPNIFMTCCTRQEIEQMFLEFKNKSKRVVKIFNEFKYVFQIYYEARTHILSVLRSMNEADEKCANIDRISVMEKFNIFLNTQQYRARDLDRYARYILKLKAGFICSVCDMEHNKFIHHYYNLKMIV